MNTNKIVKQDYFSEISYKRHQLLENIFKINEIQLFWFYVFTAVVIVSFWGLILTYSNPDISLRNVFILTIIINGVIFYKYMQAVRIKKHIEKALIKTELVYNYLLNKNDI